MNDERQVGKGNPCMRSSHLHQTNVDGISSEGNRLVANVDGMKERRTEVDVDIDTKRTVATGWEKFFQGGIAGTFSRMSLRVRVTYSDRNTQSRFQSSLQIAALGYHLKCNHTNMLAEGRLHIN
ncbi:unnamed protein product [Heligmosomoides polygyrus]|uniref:Uncharacterized protein n=1 Tax=Heligmosomoides polygyrus TaxID=6339 RepID=A0A183FD13_HELPZ|nr:unnamed protein product [Heligmosomoides polygyrus]